MFQVVHFISMRKNEIMLSNKRGAHLALEQLAEYRDQLNHRCDGPLISALTRLMNIFQSRLFLALLDIQDFYETTLLDPRKSNDEKTVAALDVAMRWENISSPSLIASTIDLRRRNSNEDLASMERARSLHQINTPTSMFSKPDIPVKLRPARNRRKMAAPQSTEYSYNPLHGADDSSSTLSFSIPNHTPSNDTSYRRFHKPMRLQQFRENVLPDSSSHSPLMSPPRQSPRARPRQRRLKRPKSFQAFSQHLDECGMNDAGMTLTGPRITTEVILNKTEQGFGFRIAGGCEESRTGAADIFVTKVIPGGPASYKGGLQLYDRILSVNGVNLVGLSHDQAVSVLQSAGSQLRMVVERVAASHESPDNINGSPVIENPCTPTNPSSTGATNLSSAALTNTSVQTNGSLFSQATSRQNGDTTRTTRLGQLSSQPESIDLGVDHLSDIKSKFLNKATSMPGPRRNRKHLTGSGFPAFSWCTGFHKITRCSSSMQPHSCMLDHQTASDSNESRTNECHVARSRTRSASRPVPAPQPGPVIVEVLLCRGTRSGLGFSIAGGVDNETVKGDTGIFITRLTPGGTADTDGRISLGDRIVQVNETSLVQVTHEFAVKTLKEAGEQVRMIVVKPDKGAHISRDQSAPTDQITMSHPSHLDATIFPATSIHSTGAKTRKSSLHIPKQTKIESNELPYEHHAKPSFASTGQELLESQMEGLVDYTAAALVSELVARWPSARLVTLYRNVKTPPKRSNTYHQGEVRPLKATGSLGMNIVGGDGSEATFVSQVLPDKPAALSKRVYVGDRILAVNGVDVSRHGHERAATELRNAADRVDLVLSYSPKEYAKFARYYHRQLRAVGNQNAADSVKQYRKQSNNTVGNEIGKRRPESGSRSSRKDRQRRSSGKELNKSHDVIYLRVQVDFDPNKENQQQATPKKAISLRSGDVIGVTNTSDPEWWQAHLVLPNSTDAAGPTGLVPSQNRLERRERIRSRHVNFGWQRQRSSSVHQTHSLMEVNGDKVITTNRCEPISGLTVSVTSLFSGRASKSDRKDIEQECFVLSYIPVTPVQLSFARPVVIMGHMKEQLADELLNEYPDRFGTVVPYTTRPCRPNEVEGRDYHFVISREIMEAEIAAHKYLEAGEYNGNLYGTPVQSVFEIAELGLHCLLNVGGPALGRLEAAGLPSIAIMVLPEQFHSDSSSVSPSPADSASALDRNSKLANLIRDFACHFTAFVTTDDFDMAYRRVREIIFNNTGPLAWLNVHQSTQ